MSEKFPFAFDFSKMSEAFQMPGMDKFEMPDMQKFFGNAMPMFDFAAMQDAQKKNMEALVEANKVAVSGYQALYKRQTEIFEATMADAKDRMSGVQGQPLTVEAATGNFETMKTAFEKALGDLKEIAEMAHSANSDAVEVIKTRTEEAVSEMKAVTDKLAS